MDLHAAVIGKLRTKPTKSQQSREKSERMNRMSRQTPLHIVLNGTHQTQDMLVCIEYE